MIGRAATMAMLLAGATAVGASAPPKRAAATLPALLPVTDADADAIRSGCETWFTQGNTGYFFQAGRDFMVRTARGRAGLNICHMTDAELQRFDNGPTPVSCGGVRIVIRPYGRATGSAEADSTQSPAAMTVSDTTHTRTLRGQFGTAC